MPANRITSPTSRVANDLVLKWFRFGEHDPEALPADARVFVRRLESGATLYRVTLGADGKAAKIHFARNGHGAWTEIQADHSGARALHISTAFEYAGAWLPAPGAAGNGSGDGSGAASGDGSGAASGEGAAGSSSGDSSSAPDSGEHEEGAASGAAADPAGAASEAEDGSSAPAPGPAGTLSNPRWNQSAYLHGGQAEMHVDAPGLDERTIEFVVEKSTDGQSWSQLAQTTAQVESGRATGRASLAHPAEQHRTDCHFADGAPLGSLRVRFRASIQGAGSAGSTRSGGSSGGSAAPAAAGSGQLSRPRWNESSFVHGSAAEMHLDAPGLDGRSVHFVVEKLNAGTWESITEATATVESGHVTGRATLQHPEVLRSGRHGPPVRLRFRAELVGADATGAAAPSGSSASDASGPGEATAAGAGSGTGSTDATGPASTDATGGDGSSAAGDGSGAGSSAEADGSGAGSGSGAHEDDAAAISQELDHTYVLAPHPTDLRQQRLIIARPLTFRPPGLSNPRWNAPDYEHGGEAIMTIDAHRLDGRTVHFTIEQSADGHRWDRLAATNALVDGGVATGRIELAHPAVAQGSRAATAHADRLLRFHATLEPLEHIAGTLTNARWGDSDYQHATQGEMHVDATGLDGRNVRFIVEHSTDEQSWEHLTESTAIVSGGHAVGVAHLEHPAMAGESNDASTHAPRSLRFRVVVDIGGSHVEAGSDGSDGSGGAEGSDGSGADSDESGSGDPGESSTDDGRLHSAQWGASDVQHGEHAEMHVEASGLNGRQILFTVEQSPDGGQTWNHLTETRAAVRQGHAVGSVRLEHPAVTERSTDSADHEPRLIRFHTRVAE